MLWYAHGPNRTASAVPASAFSKGDLLMYTSASSLSRIPTSSASLGAAIDTIIVGVAMSDSLESIDNKVCYQLAIPETVFWSDCTSGSQMTAGEKLDFEYTGATFRVTTSAITPIAVIDPAGGTQDIRGQSNSSRVKITLDPSFLHFRS